MLRGNFSHVHRCNWKKQRQYCILCISKIVFWLFVEYPDWIITRTHAEHLQSMTESKNRKGCIRKPVINIEPTSCPPDLLHMKKGIISKLINQLVDWVILQGKEEKLLCQMKEHRIPFRFKCKKKHLNAIVWSCTA